MEPRFAAVDWGTSSFRIWLIAGPETVLAERRSNEGMMHAAEVGFDVVLEQHLDALGVNNDLPVVICGMAGARQGWREAPYLTVPARLSDLVDNAVRIEGLARDVRILPGLEQRDKVQPDVMRGEETQLLGAAGRSTDLFCMPGTHSKWVCLDDNRVVRFSTHMTGELFALLTQHSILRHAVSSDTAGDPNSETFVDAVLDGQRRPAEMSRMLFSLRAGQLLFDHSQADGYERLSGLLIGAEIAAACTEFGLPQGVTLIASGRLCGLYKAALTALDITTHVVDAESAVLSGLKTAAMRFWPSASDRDQESL